MQVNTIDAIKTIPVSVNVHAPFNPDDVTVNPDPIMVTHHCTIVFTLDATTAPTVRFTGLTVTGGGGDQLGKPVISADGRTMSVEDKHTNTKREVIDFDLTFDNNGVCFAHDPQIINDPE